MASMRLAVVTGLATLTLSSFAHGAPAPPAIRDVLAPALRARPAAPAALDATVAALVDRAAAHPSQADEAAAALLLLDRNDAALDALLAAGRDADAFAMLVGGMRHAEALALPAPAADTDHALLRARTLATVGRRDEAAALLREVAATDAVRAVREASLLGMSDEAMTIALGLATGGRERELAAALWPSRRLEAETALAWLRRSQPAPAGGEALLRLREILDPAQASPDADALLQGGAAPAPDATSCEQARAAYGLVGLAELREQHELALRHAREWVAAAGTPQAWATLADMLRDRHQWAEAAAAYGKAADLSPGDGAARYMQSLMTRRLSEAKAADALLRRAEAEATTPCALSRLATAMAAVDDTASARRVRERLATSDAVDARLAAAWATTPAAIDRARERALGQPLTVARVLPVVRAAQAAEIRALTASRDLDALVALSEHALDAFVANIDETADAVDALRAAGRGADADALLARVSERIVRAASDFPESAHLLNARAWLGARTRTDLAAAREAAERAAVLRPGDPALLDTLAEVRFQQGDRPGALDAARRALALDTERPYLQRQVARIASGDPATPPEL